MLFQMIWLIIECPTYASIILFGKNPRYFLLGNYVQFVRFKGENKGGEVLNEREFSAPRFGKSFKYPGY